jgi:peptidyl-prolyl isomerase E (cyclophilin E)
MDVESRARRTLYVGGLDEAVTEPILKAAFTPFGDVSDVQVPMDYTSGKNKGFGFIEFEEEADAAAALENMNDSELYGRVLRVTIARPQKAARANNRPVCEQLVIALQRPRSNHLRCLCLVQGPMPMSGITR